MLCLLRPVAAQTPNALDLEGDTLGSAGVQLDVSSYDGCHPEAGGYVSVGLQLFTEISPPASGRSNAIVGYLDFDTDQNPATGMRSHVDRLTPYTASLGVDYFVDLSTYEGPGASGIAAVFDAAGTRVGDAEVSLAFGDRRGVSVRVTLSALGSDDGIVNTAAVIGTPAGWTDAAPNGGSVSPLQCQDDTGRLPPDIATARCAQAAGRSAAKLVADLFACHDGHARAHVAGRPFEEQACEAGARDRYLARVNAIPRCSVCVIAGAPSLADVWENGLDFLAPTPYCAGGIPFGPNHGGFLPDDQTTLQCVTRGTRRAARFVARVYDCHARHARASLTGGLFDEGRCERRGRGPYLRAIERLAGCPSCVRDNAPFIADTLERTVDFFNHLVYCAGTEAFE